jgi:hypothetical protein
MNRGHIYVVKPVHFGFADENRRAAQGPARRSVTIPLMRPTLESERRVEIALGAP